MRLIQDCSNSCRFSLHKTNFVSGRALQLNHVGVRTLIQHNHLKANLSCQNSHLSRDSSFWLRYNFADSDPEADWQPRDFAKGYS